MGTKMHFSGRRCDSRVVAGQQDDVRVVTLREAVQHLEGGMGGACGAGGGPVESAQQPEHTLDHTTTFAKMRFPRRPLALS